jgi:sulfonate transport system permease protein
MIGLAQAATGLRTPPPRAWRLPKPIPYALAIGPGLLLVLWALSSATGILDPHVLSPPWQVVETGAALARSGKLQEHLRTSLLRAGSGLCLGTIFGSVLAVIAGLTRSGEALLDGPLQLKRAVPNVALIPLLILWFGIGEGMKVITIALGVTIQIYVHTHAGLRAIDARYVELARSLRLSRWEFIRSVALPGAFPQFLLGLRLGCTAAWLSLVVVEQVNATSGIGYMMSLARSYGQTEIIVLGLVIYGALGLASDAAVRMLERRALTWRRILAH